MGRRVLLVQAVISIGALVAGAAAAFWRT